MLKTVMALSVFFAVVGFLAACGTPDKGVRVIYDDGPTAYTFAELKAVCSKCHPTSAPVIPLDEAAFKASAKIQSEIETDAMPPAAARGSFDKAKALAFFKPPVSSTKDKGGQYD